MMALSVSTWATTSPRDTCSPGCFSQLTTTPSLMVSESCGILMMLSTPSGSAPALAAGAAGAASSAVCGAAASAPCTSASLATM